MNAAEAAKTARVVFLDSAPVIYAVERFSQYLTRVDPFFDRIGRGELIAFATPVTLSECLVMPIKMGNSQLKRGYLDFFAGHPGAQVLAIDRVLSEVASELRARYRLQLPDAFQIAMAIRSKSDVFLTNDAIFRRVTEVNVVMVDDLEEPPPDPASSPKEVNEAE